MGTIGIFSIGAAIFGSYMFFLIRMVWKQHKIQAKELSTKDFKLTALEGGLKKSNEEEDDNDKIEIKYRVG